MTTPAWGRETAACIAAGPARLGSAAFEGRRPTSAGLAGVAELVDAAGLAPIGRKPLESPLEVGLRPRLRAVEGGAHRAEQSPALCAGWPYPWMKAGVAELVDAAGVCPLWGQTPGG